MTQPPAVINRQEHVENKCTISPAWLVVSMWSISDSRWASSAELLVYVGQRL